MHTRQNPNTAAILIDFLLGSLRGPAPATLCPFPDIPGNVCNAIIFGTVKTDGLGLPFSAFAEVGVIGGPGQTRVSNSLSTFLSSTSAASTRHSVSVGNR